MRWKGLDRVLQRFAPGHTQRRLEEWGRWGKSGETGPPDVQSSFRLVGGRAIRSTAPGAEMPADIAEIDGIVKRAPEDYRTILQQYYQRGVGVRMKDLALRMGISVRSYSNFLKQAEKHVQKQLC